ncbi:hypothetical protein ACRAVF_01270 [Bradyrhizobium oligotrophicum S58]
MAEDQPVPTSRALRRIQDCSVQALSNWAAFREGYGVALRFDDDVRQLDGRGEPFGYGRRQDRLVVNECVDFSVLERREAAFDGLRVED